MEPSRSFIVVLQEAIPSRNIKLDDLPGQGRLDVLCRVITSCLFLSNGFRRDTQLVAVFEKTHTFLVIQGNKVRGLNPDERSLGGILRDVFSGEKIPGMWYGPGTLEMVLKELHNWKVMVLDPRGKPFQEPIEERVAFVLGDHLGFSSHSRDLLSSYPFLSLSVNVDYLTSQTVAILHYICDKNL